MNAATPILNEILDFGEYRDRQRLLELTGESVRIRVLPHLTGGEFAISASGVSLSAELYDALQVEQCEAFVVTDDDPSLLADESLAIAGLEIAIDAARMVIQTCRMASADTISGDEKLDIAIDLLQNLKKIVPLLDHAERYPSAVYEELLRRRNL